VTAAAVGTITGAVIVLGRKSISDVPTALLALGTLGLLWKGKKIPEPLIVLGAAFLGVALKAWGRL
jgi:chromate transporter